MGGNGLTQTGSGLGGAVLGGMLAPYAGVSIPLLAATGGALGAGSSTAASGGSLNRALMLATLGGLGGFGIGSLPVFGLDPAAAEAAGASITAAPAKSASLDIAASSPDGFIVNAPGGGLSSYTAKATDGPKPGLTTLEKALVGQYLAGQLGSLLNPKPQPIAFGPIQGMTPPPVPNPTQFMIPYQAPQPPVFRL